ncbi:MAG: SH3 domain-containing protein, partial [Clostridia bacterium]|nr:SH3 domain-containing protein [Clostridia bacterium]
SALSAVLATAVHAKDGGVVEVDTRLNVRSAPSTSSSVKTRLYDGQMITLHEKSGSFYYIEYAPNSYGYVHSDYIKGMNLKAAVVATESGALNVRSGASLTSSVKDKLKKGSEVLIISTSGDFYKVLYGGNLVGYVSKAYLDAQGEGEYRKIAYSMPSYKQYNYSSLRLPGSNERVSTHGCAITSLAMTESFRLGYNVTVKDVLQNEKFTSSGAIYWPAAYSYGGTSLAEIYKRLAGGSPVIIHVKTSSGKAHFAVVTGFSGGALTASNFKINDPGSAARATLADLYKEYPIGVKTLYL